MSARAIYNNYILIAGNGAPYNQVLARMVRKLGIFSKILSYDKAAAEVLEKKPAGIIITGRDTAVDDKYSADIPEELLKAEVPVLLIGAPMRKFAVSIGGDPEKRNRFSGRTKLKQMKDSLLFKGIQEEDEFISSFSEVLTTIPTSYDVIAINQHDEIAAIENKASKIYAVEFYPEDKPGSAAAKMLKNFIEEICRAEKTWNMQKFLEEALIEVKEQVGNGKVLLALSGGVDSSVLAALLSKAIGNRLTAIFVDTGFMRKNEGNEVEAAFKDFDLNFIRVNAADRYLSKLKGVSEPEQKRKIIGEEFIRIFEEEAKKIGQVDFLAQGTIYADIVESGVGDSHGLVKSHHNVGGLPEHVDFKELIEPFKTLFKDDIRELGRQLGLPGYIVNRQPFPGPGLAIRVMGELSFEKLETLREADAIWREELEAAGSDPETGTGKLADQYFAILTSNRSVGVKDELRTYEYTLALRAVKTADFMSAKWARLPYDLLEKASSRIISEVDGINRVVYDISSKPPATIEWE